MNAWRKRIADAAGVAVVAVAAASLAALLAPVGWPFELFAHFRWQVGAAAAALLIASLLLRRPWMMVLALAALMAQGLPALLPGRTAAAHASLPVCSGPELRVVTVNAWFGGTEHAALVDWLARSDADLIALQEVTPGWETALAPLFATYPHRLVLARDDAYGIALLSRWPFGPDTGPVDFADDGLPSLVASVTAPDGRTVRFIAMHTRWPVTRDLQQRRDRSLQAAAQRVAADGATATVLAGDLNLTPYAPAFARLLTESGLRDALADTAWRPTWQAGLWPLALPIDHVLVPRDACVLAHSIGPDVGSDHRPLQVELRLP
jgi:endonuclease/exonuclease/phosphatase (EEP) superfamily protein YafD